MLTIKNPAGFTIMWTFILAPIVGAIFLLVFLNPGEGGIGSSEPIILDVDKLRSNPYVDRSQDPSLDIPMVEDQVSPLEPGQAPPRGNYVVGQILKSYDTVLGCVPPTEPSQFYQDLIGCSSFHVHFGDKVEILGEAQLFNHSGNEVGWYWPIRIVEAVGRFEGTEVWVSDKTELVPSSLAEPRYEPDFTEGEVVAIGYPSYLMDDAGNWQWVRSGQKATVLAAPLIGNDGQYSCHVRTESRFIGWMHCELQKLE